MPQILTTCIYCGCGCNLYLNVDGNNNLIGSFPSTTNKVNKGSLCVKGWHAHEFVNHPDRLKTPLIRNSNGNLEETSWDNALSLTVSKLKELQRENGNDCISFFSSAKCTNEENYLLMKLARAVFKTNNIDHCARLCHASTVLGLTATFGSAAMTNSINEFQDADCFLVTGSNTTEQHPLIGSRIITAIKRNNASLILVDPRNIRLSKFASMHLKQIPGTDVAWLNGLMNVIIEANLFDKEFIEKRCENFEELKQTVAKYTPEYVEKITGIKKEDLIEAAKIYAKSKTAMIVYSMGITQHTSGVNNVKNCANLAMLTGNVGKLHTGVNPLRGQNNVQGACDLGALPNVYTGYQKITDNKIRQKFETHWGVEDLPSTPGLTITGSINKAYEGELKGLFIMGENPMVSDPNINHVRKALKNLEFLVVQDIFLTETAQLADVVLPACSFAEKDGTFTNTERRITKIRQAIKPLHNSKEDWQIICELSTKAGYNMHYNNTEDIIKEITELTPIYKGITYAKIDPYGIQWPCLCLDDPGTEILHKEKFSKGTGTFMPVEYYPSDEITDDEYNLILTTGRTYWHFHTRTMTSRTQVLEREVPEAYVEINTKDAKDRQIKNNQMITVSTKRGSITLEAVVTDNIKQGVIFIPFHFASQAANDLTNDAIDKEAEIPEYKICAAKVTIKDEHEVRNV